MAISKSFKMNWLLLIPLLLMGYYIYLLRRYLHFWHQIPIWKIPGSFQPKTKVTVIIPARNEAENIAACLNSVCQQHFPTDLYEVLLVDDHSTDQTNTIAAALGYTNLKIITLADHVDKNKIQSFKKLGIATAIDQATGTLIVTTDADCVVSPDWLNYLVSFYEAHSYKFIAAPVNFYHEKNTLEKFQSLDFQGMMGITGAGIQGDFMRMCNGANLAYEKSAYTAVNGFTGIDQLASGDDMLLMQKVISTFPGSVGYLKNLAACTFTRAQPNLNSFVSQRLRWASKSAAYPEWQVTFILAMTFFFCWSIILSFLLIPFFGKEMFLIFVVQFLVKSFMDYQLLSTMTRFFHRDDLLKTFWTSQVMHIVYVAGIGLLANLKKEYNWKGRVVR